MGPREMHLGVFVLGTGNHTAGWRYDGAATSNNDLALWGQAHDDQWGLRRIGFTRADDGATPGKSRTASTTTPTGTWTTCA